MICVHQCYVSQVLCVIAYNWWYVPLPPVRLLMTGILVCTYMCRIRLASQSLTSVELCCTVLLRVPIGHFQNG